MNAVKLNPQDLAATGIVKLMNDLFAIDAEAREKNMDHAARHGLRLEKAPALLDKIRAQVLEAQKNALPQERYGQGRQLHAGTMEQAHAIPRIPRAGVIQQPRGEKCCCAPLRLAERTGYTSAALRLDPRSLRSNRS